jgi:hypothetical protein
VTKLHLSIKQDRRFRQNYFRQSPTIDFIGKNMFFDLTQSSFFLEIISPVEKLGSSIKHVSTHTLSIMQ